ncbi:MAG: ATP12 family protein [Hyphomicrobiaceae bacterium]
MSPPENGDDLGPMQRAQRQMRPELPRRFYQAATVADADGGATVQLDGRSVRTPAKRLLVVPTAELAEAIAGEWRAQGERIDPASMPLTRLANTVIDAVAERMPEVRADALNYAGTDLVCYRATHPAALVALQARHWDPLLDWVRRVCGAALVTTAGLGHQPQPAATIDAIRSVLDGLDAFALAGLHELTTLSGSLVIALAIREDEIDTEAGWAAAHVDEDWQVSQWGEDFEASERRKIRRRDFEAAARLIRLAGRE